MKLHEIEKLIEKFYGGETTLKEEELLRAYLNQKDIPKQFQAARDYFNFLQNEKELEMNDSFDEKILQTIELKEDKSNTLKVWTYRLSGVAAVILVFDRRHICCINFVRT